MSKDWTELAKLDEIKRDSEEMKRVIFVPYTERSELAKRIRSKMKLYENIGCIRLRIVEKTGEKIMNMLHKSNPWKNLRCMRDDCGFCEKVLMRKCGENVTQEE